MNLKLHRFIILSIKLAKNLIDNRKKSIKGKKDQPN